MMKRVNQTWPRVAFVLLGTGFAYWFFLGAGLKQELSAQVRVLQRATPQDTRLVLSQAGAAYLPGSRAIAGVFLDTKKIALLIDGGGPRYLSLGGTQLVEVCATAATLRANSGRVAVGCAKLGTSPPMVQWVELETNAIRARSLPDPGNTPPTEASWPFVSHQLQYAAVATAAKLRIYDLGNGEEIFSARSTEPHADVSDIAFSPDDRHIAVAYNDGLIEVFDWVRKDSATLIIPPKKDDRNPRLAFSPSGALASASFWGHFQLLSLASKEPVYQISPAAERYGFSDVAFVGPRWIVHIEAGKFVLRTNRGVSVKANKSPSTSKTIPKRLFAPGLDGGLGLVEAGPGTQFLTISADGQKTVVYCIEPETSK